METTNAEGDYLGEDLPIPTEDYSGEMSPSKARVVTLKEVIAFCEEAMRTQERDSGDGRGVILTNPDKYFSYKSVKEHCENLINQIKW